jgi:ethanolamine permease
VEYVLTPAVIVFFIGSYMGSIFGTPPAWQPLWWIGFYIVFIGLNIIGVELSFKITLAVTLLALACLVAFWVSAFPRIDFARWAMNVGAGGAVLPEGRGPFLPLGFGGVLAALPFAVWLFLAIEQLPLAAEESVDPRRDMPRGIIAGIFTLIVSAFMILWLNPSVAGIQGEGGRQRHRRRAARQVPAHRQVRGRHERRLRLLRRGASAGT